MNKITISHYLTLFITLLSSLSFGQDHSKTYLFVGSYTDGKEAEGIIIYEFNLANGELTEVEREGNLINPSFLSLSPNGRNLYACTESRLERDGSVSAFKIDSTSGKITFLNKQSVGGRNPVHVTVDKESKNVIVSNYTDAGISVFSCNPDGSLQPFSELLEFTEGSNVIKGRQDEAHIHSGNFSLDNKFFFAPDLGADKIRAFSFDHKNLLSQSDSLTVNTNKGSGPRHFTFHPNHAFAFSVEELSGTVAAYSYKKGQLHLLNTYKAYEKEHEKYSSADIHVSPDGKYLYVSNRKAENSISIFRINSNNGKLTPLGHQDTYGMVPRSFVIDPSGKFLIVANKTSNDLVVFKRHLETGLLTKVKQITGLSAPSSLKMRTYGQ